jgi:macrolide transport system ATP-binding/permease protein
MELIRLEDITKTYHLGEIDVPVLKGISLTIRRGEMVALMGASGSGKTTLMNILGCLDRPSSGKFWLDGEEMSQLTPNQRALVRTAKLGFVFQSFNLLPRTTALHNVTMPLDYSPNRPHSATALLRARALLDRVGIADRADHEPSQMSGGQQQRVAIARSLINRPALVLADEPTGNLDSHTSAEILRMFQQLNAEGITVVLVTHDPKVATYAHRTIRIADGLIEGDETRVPETAGGPPLAPMILREHGGNGNGSMHVADHGEATVLTPALGAGSAFGAGQPTFGAGLPIPPAVARSGDHATTLASPVKVAAPAARSAERATTERAEKPLPATASPARSAHADEEAGASRRMTLSSLLPPTFRTALRALRRNKMRSALTALGVIIGVAAVIAMTGIGQGSSKAIQKTIATMGANNLIIFPGAAMSGGISWGTGSRPTLTPADCEQLLLQCPAILAVAPLVQTQAQLVYGHNNWKTQSVVGSTPDYLVVRDWTDMEEGDVFSDRDVLNANKVCMIGATLKRELFGGESPIGKEMRVSNVSFRVIGVLSRKGANMMGRDQDDIVVAPWTTIKYRVNANLNMTGLNAAANNSAASTAVNSLNNLYPPATALYDAPSTTQAADTPQNIAFVTVDTILAKAASTPQIPEAIREIKGLLRERHHIQTPSEDDDSHDDFNIRDMTEITRTLSSTTALVGILLLIVAAISLVVGGVGIMNIMLVSVTERTREIGLRMAVGARSYHILRQFLVEAVVLCLVGGAIGVFFGWGISETVHLILNWATSVSLLVISISVIVSATVGIVFGFYPAWKASRLDPIEALRYE